MSHLKLRGLSWRNGVGTYEDDEDGKGESDNARREEVLRDAVHGAFDDENQNRKLEITQGEPHDTN